MNISTRESYESHQKSMKMDFSFFVQQKINQSALNIVSVSDFYLGLFRYSSKKNTENDVLTKNWLSKEEAIIGQLRQKIKRQFFFLKISSIKLEKHRLVLFRTLFKYPIQYTADDHFQLPIELSICIDSA